MRVRGNTYQVMEKYLALARDASLAGDRIAMENYLQHAEHYYRILMAQGGQLGAQPQYAPQGQPNGNGDARPPGGEGYQPQQQQPPMVAGSTPSFSLADQEDMEEGDEVT